MPISGVGGLTSSNTSTPCRRILDPTHRDTKNSQNLTSRRDPEGELAEGIDSASTRILGGRSIIFIIITTIIIVVINIYIHSTTLVVIPRPSCGFVEVFIHPYVYHSYYCYDVDYLHV
jgi:hypothetical protein